MNFESLEAILGAQLDFKSFCRSLDDNKNVQKRDTPIVVEKLKELFKDDGAFEIRLNDEETGVKISTETTNMSMTHVFDAKCWEVINWETQEIERFPELVVDDVNTYGEVCEFIKKQVEVTSDTAAAASTDTATAAPTDDINTDTSTA